PLADCIAAVAPLLSRDNDQEILHAAPTYLTVAELLAATGVAGSERSATFRVQREDGREVDARLEPLPIEAVKALAWANVRERTGAAAPLYLSRTADWYWQATLA